MEKEALARGYEPFATVTIPMPVQQSAIVGGQKGMNILFFMSYRKEYPDDLVYPDSVIWDGLAPEVEDGS